jgi:hypothetical protein
MKLPFTFEFTPCAACVFAYMHSRTQWMRGDTVLPGATKPVLVIPSATAEDCVSRFVCIASNGVADTVSAPAFIEYTPALPVITVDLARSVVVARGERAVLEVHGQWSACAAVN